MKKLINFVAAGLLSAGAFAQDTIPSKMKSANSPGMNSTTRAGMDTVPVGRKFNKSDTGRMNRTNNWPDSSGRRNNRNRSKPDSTGSTFNDPMSKNSVDSSMAATGKWPDSSMANNPGTGTTGDSAAPSSMANSAGTNNSMNNNSSSISSSVPAAITSKEKEITDRVIMKDGQMMMVKSGDTTQMADKVTLSSGAVVMKNGSVKYKSGKVTQLKDGQFVNLTPVADEKMIKKTTAISSQNTKTNSPTKKKTND